MRPLFFKELHKQMTLNANIVAVTFDLGYGGFDQIKTDYPKRFFNVGASEQAGMDIAVGLALSGKKVFVYSITPFLIYRAFETIRNYVNHEKLPIILVASVRDKDYPADGISPWSEEVKPILNTLPNIIQYYPTDKKEIPLLVEKMAKENSPQFISLKRGE